MPEPMPPPRSLFFHEDDDSQIELLPLAAWPHCRRTLAELHASAEAHFDGAGYAELVVRPDAPHSLGELRLPPDAVAAAAAAQFPAYDEIWTGYSTSRTRCRGLRAWGEDGFALFADGDEASVEGVWLLADRWWPRQAPRIAALLRSLPAAGELLLVDWPWGHLFALSDAPALERWLAERTAES